LQLPYGARTRRIYAPSATFIQWEKNCRQFLNKKAQNGAFPSFFKG